MSRAPIKRRKFTVILEAECDGGYSVHCPALPGCVSQGDDRRSALANVKEAIELVLDVSVERSAEMPDSEGDSPSYLETPARIAEEIREVLKGREQDGLPFAGISLEQVEIVVKALP